MCWVWGVGWGRAEHSVTDLLSSRLAPSTVSLKMVTVSFANLRAFVLPQ